ncbi:MAG: cupin domain-containing protein [Gemmatimonadales bacterium]
MRPTKLLVPTTLLMALSTTGASAQTDTPGLKWRAAPAIFPKGAEMAVIQGDPGSSSLFTVRLRLPAGYRLAPHIHPTDHKLTVIHGSYAVGMGASISPTDMRTMGPGESITEPSSEAHYAIARTATEVQLRAKGPFRMTYINPADIPPAAQLASAIPSKRVPITKVLAKR